MSLPSFEGLTEVREALLTDRAGGVLDATRPGARERGAAPLARTTRELADTGSAFGLGPLELLAVSGASQATLAAVRPDALLVAVAQPGIGRSQVEKVLRAWISGLAPAARTAPSPAASPSTGRPAIARADPWVALRRALARAQLGEVPALRPALGAPPAAGPSAGAEPIPPQELDRALQLLVEGIGGVQSGDGASGERTLAELALSSQPNLSIRWIALHWRVRAAIRRCDFDAARDRVREALRLVPQLDVDARAVTQWTAAEVLAQKGDPARALEWLRDSRKRFESLRDGWGVARTWLAEARILVRQEREAEGVSAAREAADADHAWPDPASFLARRALTRGDAGGARAVLERLTGPAAERARTLVRAVEDGSVTEADAAELLRAPDQPPTDAPLAPLQQGAEATAQTRDAVGSSGFSGSISVLSVPDVLEFLRGARRTGLLLCSSAQGRAALRFQDGWITGLAPAPAGVRDEQALCARIEETIRELVQWKDGEFAFSRDEGGDPEDELRVRLDVQAALLNVFRQMDEDARAAAESAAGGTVACA